MKREFFLYRQLYTIQIDARKEGYNFCSYRIVTTDEYRLNESSINKILHRLLNTFNLYIEHFSENAINTIIHDLEILAEKFEIPEEYAKSKILQLRKLEE